MQPDNLSSAFLARTPIPSVHFNHNDHILIKSGPNAGATGYLVTVISLEPEPEFVIELESGFDVRVLQSQIGHHTPETQD
jgi:hypothetical protein